MHTDRKPVVVGLGEILWDMLPKGRRLGGAPANFAYHCHAMGARGIVVSAVGQDRDGEDILDSLTELGIETTYIAKNDDFPTGTVTVELSPQGQAAYTIHSPVAWDYIPWTESPASLAKQCDAVCFGSLAQRNSISRESIRRFLESTPGECLRVFDINIRQDYATREIVVRSLGFADILKLNDEELPALFEMIGANQGDRTETVVRLMSDYQLSHVILTKGAAGSVIYTKDQVSFCESQEVPIVDTVGAGDAFTAAVVMGLLEDKPLTELHQRASRIADYVCTKPGATPLLGRDLL